jgi:CBS domain-containing protein
MKWSPYDYARRTTPSCELQLPLMEAARIFAEEEVGSILVKDGRGGYAGLLTARVVMRALSEGKDLSLTQVGQMTLEPAVYVSKDAGMDEVRERFTQSPSGRLLMTDGDGNVVGVLKRKNLERFSLLGHVGAHVNRHIRHIGNARAHVQRHVGKLLKK